MHLDRYWFISSTILTSSWELCYWEEMIWTIFNGLEKVAGKTFSRHASWDCKGISIFSQTVNLPVFRLWWTTDITKFKTFFFLSSGQNSFLHGAALYSAILYWLTSWERLNHPFNILEVHVHVCIYFEPLVIPRLTEDRYFQVWRVVPLHLPR